MYNGCIGPVSPMQGDRACVFGQKGWYIMKLTWHGHSCFTLDTAAGVVALDPYAPQSVPGYPPLHLTADRVYSSHGHSDHYGTGQVSLTGEPCTVEVEEIRTFHDPEDGALRGENTIRIFSAEGLRVAHLGDLGCDLTPEQEAALTGLDALMIPVGGYYTIDAAQAWALARRLNPRVVIPMHYRFGEQGYQVLAPLDDFLALVDRPVEWVGPTLTLTKDTPCQVAVLRDKT